MKERGKLGGKKPFKGNGGKCFGSVSSLHSSIKKKKIHTVLRVEKNASGKWVEDNKEIDTEPLNDIEKVNVCPLRNICSSDDLEGPSKLKKNGRKSKKKLLNCGSENVEMKNGPKLQLLSDRVNVTSNELKSEIHKNTKLGTHSKPIVEKLKSNKKSSNLGAEDVQSNKPTNTEIMDSSSKCLNVRAGFFWGATPDQLPVVQKLKIKDLSSEDESVTEEHSRKKKKRMNIVEKRELARLEEERVRKIEERLMNAEKNPQSADDFDRLVMSAPNRSQNWIKYMAYHLEATEIGKARAVAQRALKTISFREEQEKLNVWMALLNLENLFGTHESLEQTLQEAVQMNEPYKVYMQALNMFSASKKVDELFKLVQLVIKKYKHSKETWIQAGTAYMKCGEVEKSRQLMQKSLTVLDKKFHVEVLSRFATLENEVGNSERAETIMENILTSYPKRIDVWNVYIDMLIKSKKLDLARQVLDRAVIQKLPASKMKSLFKKYMKFEQDHGNPEGIEKIREMAKKYVETAS